MHFWEALKSHLWCSAICICSFYDACEILPRQILTKSSDFVYKRKSKNKNPSNPNGSRVQTVGGLFQQRHDGLFFKVLSFWVHKNQTLIH